VRNYVSTQLKRARRKAAFRSVLKNLSSARRPSSLILHDREAGFFSLFFQVVGALDFCRTLKLTLHLEFNEGPYAEDGYGNNWWLYYFQQDTFPFNRKQYNRNPIFVKSLPQQIYFSNLGHAMPAEKAYRICRSIGILPRIEEKAAQFVKDHFTDKCVIGVHYRGTDKVIGAKKEALRVPYDYVANTVTNTSLSDQGIFVATDEAQFLAMMKKAFGKRVVSYDAIRSNSGVAPHLNHCYKCGFRLGEDALMDCLILSKTNLLLRTESNLSHACRCFNPYQQCVNLTKAYQQDHSEKARSLSFENAHPLREGRSDL
jgi:hypothetical protein